MSFLVVGDLHGKIDVLAKIDQWCAQNGIEYVIQVGDLGVYWPGQTCPIIHYFQKRAEQNRVGPIWISCLGNHDNWNKFETLRWEQADRSLNNTKDGFINSYPDFIQYAPGFCVSNRPAYSPLLGGMLFLGGAVSTDSDDRILDKSWWAQESPSLNEQQVFCDMIDDTKPRWIFTHDGPQYAHKARGGYMTKSGLRSDELSRSYDVIAQVNTHKARCWFFGHHHSMTTETKYDQESRCSGLHGQGWLVREKAVEDPTSNPEFDIEYWSAYKTIKSPSGSWVPEKDSGG